MTTQERMALFGVENPKDLDPRLFLLENVISGLTRGKQVQHIITVLQQKGAWESFFSKEAISLVEALEKLFEGQKMELRSILMKIQHDIPMVVDGNYYNQEKKLENAPELHLAILGKIIRGWDGTSNWVAGQPHHLQPSKDSEDCFFFLCRTFRVAPIYQRDGRYLDNAGRGEGRIRKGILQLFREHLEIGAFILNDSRIFNLLDPWILNEETPEHIADVLLHAQLRFGGVRAARERIRHLQPKD